MICKGVKLIEQTFLVHVKGGEFLDHLGDYQLLNIDSAPWTEFNTDIYW